MKNILLGFMAFIIAIPVLTIENKTSLTAGKLLSDGKSVLKKIKGDKAKILTDADDHGRATLLGHCIKKAM